MAMKSYRQKRFRLFEGEKKRSQEGIYPYCFMGERNMESTRKELNLTLRLKPGRCKVMVRIKRVGRQITMA